MKRTLFLGIAIIHDSDVIVFHIALPTYPLILLIRWLLITCGNANVVKVPSREFPQIDLICSSLDKLCNDRQ